MPDTMVQTARGKLDPDLPGGQGQGGGLNGPSERRSLP